jgi:hypothetical protein
MAKGDHIIFLEQLLWAKLFQICSFHLSSDPVRDMYFSSFNQWEN